MEAYTQTTGETEEARVARVKAEFLAFKRPQSHEQDAARRREEAAQKAAATALHEAAQPPADIL